jgi:hypothetical protein
MNSITVVVEGQLDVVLLRKLLRRQTDVAFRFFAARGRASLATVGRNILVHDGGPLLIVMDAGTFDPAQAESSCIMVKAALRRVSPDDRFDVFAFVPELEIVFFESPGVLARRFGPSVTDQRIIDRGNLRPGRTLQEILHETGVSRASFFEELTDAEIDELLQGEQTRQLISAVEALTVSVSRLPD